MVRPLGSTCALGLEAIFFGSVTAWGAGRVWAVRLSPTTVLMSMTIAKSVDLRVGVELHRTPGFICRVADIFERAIDAFGLAGNAELAAVPDDLVSEENPFLARNNAHQVLLDFLGVGIGGEFQTAGDAVYVGVNDYPFSYFEPRAQDDVGGLASHAR